MNIVINPVFEIPYIVFIGIITLITTVYLYLDVSRNLRTIKRYSLLFLRTIAILLLVIILLQPSQREKNTIKQGKSKIVIAIDSSKSMRQKDIQQASRIDIAKSIVLDSQIFTEMQKQNIEFYEFARQARSLSTEKVHFLSANGQTTYFHSAISEIFAQQNYNINKLILLTDGHDWENEPPTKTATLARLHHIPIFAIPLGGEGHVRDISVQLMNIPPYTYIEQKFRIEVLLHMIGCEYEELTVELKREGKVVDKKNIKTEDKRELTVIFEKDEEKTGQFEYQVAVYPLKKEVDLTNNSLISYSQTIDQPIKILLLEGQPYWDTTFLQRFLVKNDKIDFNAFIQYSPGKIRRIISTKQKTSDNQVKLPSSIEEFCEFDIILLGKSIDEFLNETQLNLLNDYVKSQGGSVIFTRGNAYSNEFTKKNNLTPVVWDSEGNDKILLKMEQEAPFKSVFRNTSQQKILLVSRKSINKKSLAIPWAMAVDNKDKANTGIIYRAYGRGHVVSIGVEGLWQWAFHDKAEKKNNLFTHFWQQILLWLVMNSDFMPGKDHNFKMSGNNLFLGEKIYFQYNIRSAQKNYKPVLEINDPDGNVEKLSLVAGNLPGRFSGEYLPNKKGKYSVKVISPQLETAKFIVYHSQPEEREVFVDRNFLTTLCRESGGKVISDKELPKLIQAKNSAQKQEKLRLIPVWDNLWLIYCICTLLACDWFLRRKWGLC